MNTVCCLLVVVSGVEPLTPHYGIARGGVSVTLHDFVVI